MNYDKKWYCGFESFLSLSIITRLFPLYFRCPPNILTALKDFKILPLAFFPLTFGISSGKHLPLTKFSIFLKSTCLLRAIFLKFVFNQKEKRGFNCPKTFGFYFKNIQFFIKKNRCSLKIVVPEFFSSQCVYWLSFFEHLSLIKKKSVLLFGLKLSIFCFKKIRILIFLKKELLPENSCSWISKKYIYI